MKKKQIPQDVKIWSEHPQPAKGKKEAHPGKAWCWKTLNGSGTHESSYANAARAALNSAKLNAADFDLRQPTR